MHSFCRFFDDDKFVFLKSCLASLEAEISLIEEGDKLFSKVVCYTRSDLIHIQPIEREKVRKMKKPRVSRKKTLVKVLMSRVMHD